jgi:hypothetical protein
MLYSYLLDYGIAALQKPKSEEKKEKFRTIIFFPLALLICVTNKKMLSADHIGRATTSLQFHVVD